MDRKMYLVQEVDEGVPQIPKIFNSLEQAAALFEEQVTDPEIGFRKKYPSESWEDYEEAFVEYTYSEEVAFDTLDWEIHLFEQIIDDAVLTALSDLYYAIINHAGAYTLVQETVRKKLEAAQSFLPD